MDNHAIDVSAQQWLLLCEGPMKRFIDVASSICTAAASLMLIWVLANSGHGAVTAGPPDALTGQKAVENLDDRRLTIDVGRRLTAQPAGVVLIEFSDFECPYCARFAQDTLPQLRHDYIDNGKVSYLFVNYPLDRVHPGAFGAAQVAICAAEQERFWPVHDFLFLNQHSLQIHDLVAHAPELQLNEQRLSSCLEDAATKVRLDQGEGRRLQVVSTPTFFVGSPQAGGLVSVRRKIDGARPYSVFRDVLDAMMRG
jgi:protein-disulfide isomerase